MDVPTHALFTCCKDLGRHFKLAPCDIHMEMWVTALTKGGRSGGRKGLCLLICHEQEECVA